MFTITTSVFPQSKMKFEVVGWAEEASKGMIRHNVDPGALSPRTIFKNYLQNGAF